MTASPTSCLKCGHRFPPGTPEPSWCPGCGKLCSAFDVPDEPPGPDEIPETPQEQRRLRVWFWVLFLAGPVTAGLASAFRKQGISMLPAWLQPFTTAGWECWLALAAGAVGAGFCLARLLYPRRRMDEQIVAALAMGLALMMAYLALAVAAMGLFHLLVFKVIK